MIAFVALCKKEFLESWRTYRLWIMLAVFVFFGILSPATAKLLPELLNGVDMGGGQVLNLPDPTAMDSWAQFFKNISQMGALVLIIVFCGLMANELSKGTLVNVLTKGAPRPAVVLAKFVVAGFLWTVSYLLSLGVTYLYNSYFWGVTPLPNAFLAFACLWLFGLLLIALMILGGLLTRSIAGALVAVAVVVVGLNIVNIAPHAARFNPISLATNALGLLSGDAVPGDIWPAFGIAAASVIALVVASLVVFDKKQMVV